MESNDQKKITSSHLTRKAFLYVRQSTLRQVYENQESTERQYALQQKAIGLGWGKEQIEVIDTDLGISASGKIDREGFAKLVSEVGMGNAGLVMGLEVSRLARSCSDWHKLLEICALTETLILDEDGIYNPTHFNDRLLLGLKGSMSEAELHILRARLHGGLLNKARKGELYKKLPVGYVYNSESKIALDPDKQVQHVIKLLFKKFKQTGSAHGTMRYFQENNIKFPKRIQDGANKGELFWGQVSYGRIYTILHNPCYAGAYTFGRSHTKKRINGSDDFKWKPQEEWWSLIKNFHPEYITWSEYQENLGTFKRNKNSKNCQSTLREGTALLQGLILCGFCGRRMTAKYYRAKKGLTPIYCCSSDVNDFTSKGCQCMQGQGIDNAVSELLLELVGPEILELTLGVQEEIQKQIHEVEKIQHQQVDRLQYEVDLAKRRYMQVDPENRLVADTLEKEWDDKLKAHKEVCEEFERQRQIEIHKIDNDIKSKIMSLATDFPKIWNDSKTSHKEKKRLARLMIEDVTILRKDTIHVHVRFKGGNTKSLEIDPPEKHGTPSEIVSKIDALLDSYTYTQIADILNQQGYTTGKKNSFNDRAIKHIRTKFKLKTRKNRLREKGFLTLNELSNMLSVKQSKLRADINKNKIKIIKYKLSDNNECMYKKPDQKIINDYKSSGAQE